MQGRIWFTEKFLSQHGAEVTTVTETGRDLQPLAQVFGLSLSWPQYDDSQVLPL